MSKESTHTRASLLENEHVKELLGIMQENSVSTQNLLEVIGYVGLMERQLDTAVSELSFMRAEIMTMREEQNHPVRTALQKTADSLEVTVTKFQERLDAVKNSIVQGAKNTVAAFKQKGISALSSVMNFFRVKDTLEGIQKGMAIAIKSAENSIAKIETVSTEYHEIGKHIKNIGRAFVGKEPLEQAKPVGKLAKTVQAPHAFRKKVVSGAIKGVAGAIDNLDKLESKAKKPSVLGNLAKLKEHVAQTEAKAPSTTKSKEASL